MPITIIPERDDSLLVVRGPITGTFSGDALTPFTPKTCDRKRRATGRKRFHRRSNDPVREQPGQEPWDQLGTVLNAVLARTLPRHKTDFAVLEQHWLDLVGREVAMHSRPGGVRGNTLTVFVSSSVWMQELQVRGTARTVLTAVRALMPGTPIERVRFRCDPGG